MNCAIENYGGIKDTKIKKKEEITFTNLTLEYGFQIVFGIEGKSEQVLKAIQRTTSPGTSFEDLPDDWVCPACGVGKEYFEKTV